MKKSSKKLVSVLCAMTFLFGNKVAKVQGITKTNVRQFTAAVMKSVVSLYFCWNAISGITDVIKRKYRHHDISEFATFFSSVVGLLYASTSVSSWIDFASNLKKQNSSKK